jgi:hypothetical protein
MTILIHSKVFLCKADSMDLKGFLSRVFWSSVSGLLWFTIVVAIWTMGLTVLAANAAPGSTLANEAPAIVREPINAGDIPMEKVHQFIQAYLKIVNLLEARHVELQGAETEPESLRVQQSLETQAFRIIEQMGLTHQEYLQLLSLANTDLEFGEQVALLLQETGEAQ